MDAPTPFDPAVLTSAGALRGGRCTVCRLLFVPYGVECPRCGGSAAEEAPPDHGRIVAVTTTELPIHGATSPATVALVELTDDLVVQGVVITGRTSVGDRVGLVGRDLPGGLLGYGFAAASHA